MFGLGLLELFIIALLVLLLFGAKRIPNLLRGLGEGIRNFRREVRDDVEEKGLERREDRGSDRD